MFVLQPPAQLRHCHRPSFNRRTSLHCFGTSRPVKCCSAVINLYVSIPFPTHRIIFLFCFAQFFRGLTQTVLELIRSCLTLPVSGSLFQKDHRISAFIFPEKRRWFNLLKPTGYVMHQQFNIQQLYALLTLYLCVLCLSENKWRLAPLTA